MLLHPVSKLTQHKECVARFRLGFGLCRTLIIAFLILRCVCLIFDKIWSKTEMSWSYVHSNALTTTLPGPRGEIAILTANGHLVLLHGFVVVRVWLLLLWGVVVVLLHVLVHGLRVWWREYFVVPLWLLLLLLLWIWKQQFTTTLKLLSKASVSSFAALPLRNKMPFKSVTCRFKECARSSEVTTLRRNRNAYKRIDSDIISWMLSLPAILAATM